MGPSDDGKLNNSLYTMRVLLAEHREPYLPHFFIEEFRAYPVILAFLGMIDNENCQKITNENVWEDVVYSKLKAIVEIVGDEEAAEQIGRLDCAHMPRRMFGYLGDLADMDGYHKLAGSLREEATEELDMGETERLKQAEPAGGIHPYGGDNPSVQDGVRILEM